MTLSKVKTFTTKVANNLDGESYSIEADAEFFNHLSKRIYTDSMLAIVRELVCNAWDSHVDAGNTHIPITVQAPNILDPVFKVIDRGVGMDLDTLKSIYSSYGRSTKRSNMDVTGGLGVGSKTPFAYTDSFTVYSVKDGYKHTMVNYKDNGIPKIKEIITMPTNEPNGVEIHVPVKVPDFPAFLSRIQSIGAIFNGLIEVTGVSNWDVKVNNIYSNPALVTRLRFEDYSYPENVFLVESSRLKSFGSVRMLILMGNVPYQLDISKLTLDDKVQTFITSLPKYKTTLCVEVPIGTLDFSMSREHLEYSERTIDWLSEYLTSVHKDIVAHGEALVEVSPTPYDKYQLRMSLYKHNSAIFDEPRGIRTKLVRLDSRKRKLETIKSLYGEIVTQRISSTSHHHVYWLDVPDTGKYNVTIVCYQNRTLKRKKIHKLVQDGSLGFNKTHTTNILFEGTRSQADAVADIVRNRTQQFGDNVTVEVYDLADVEVEREPMGTREKIIGRMYGQSYEVTTTDATGYDDGQNEDGRTFKLAYLISKSRSVDLTQHDLTIDDLENIRGQFVKMSNGNDHEFRLFELNSSCIKFAAEYDCLVPFNTFVEQYSDVILTYITNQVNKQVQNLVYHYSTDRERSKFKLSHAERGDWNWTTAERGDWNCTTTQNNLVKLSNFSEAMGHGPLSEFPCIRKQLRRQRVIMKREDRQSRNIDTSHYTRIVFMLNKMKEHKTLFEKYSKKRNGKLRYTKRK